MRFARRRKGKFARRVILSHPQRLPRQGDSSQGGDETTRLTPIPNSRVGFRSVLNHRCATSAFVAQRSSQRATRKPTPREKPESSRCQHKPRVQALIGWFLNVVVGVHLALLPVRRRERPCAE